MSSTRGRIITLAFSLSYLFPTASAGVLWMPEAFNPADGRTLLPRQDSGTCSGNPTLNQCPSDFPPNFCCGQDTTCLHINTNNASITAAICCPDGQSCTIIQPFNCNPAVQDATTHADSQLHSIPPQQLNTCGAGCCPMGYACQNGHCVAQVSLSTGSGSASKPSTTPSPTRLPDSSTASSSPTPSKSQSTAASGSSGPTFSGKSFAAGFVPGIALGVIIAALLIFCCTRKSSDRKRSRSPDAEKSRDTLTDLGPQIGRPMMHGRSISEPTVDPSAMGVTRTDFLRSSPTRTIGSNDIINNNYDSDLPPQTPTGRTPKIKALFSRSPFMSQAPTTPPQTQPPLPAHLKRGTLSFHQVSPIRALKKQKSMHSLRRQMSEHRTDSTETIQVLMSPDEEPSYKAAGGPWSTTVAPMIAPSASRGPPQRVPYASSSRYPSEQQPMGTNFRMPTPPPPVPRHQTGGPTFLDSPYTPTKTQGQGKASAGGLAVPGQENQRRDTTFSSLMEKAGLRKSELVMGSKKKIDAKYGY